MGFPLKTGEFKGRACVILGGGPSVDPSLVGGDYTIGCNRRYELDPDMVFVMDIPFIPSVQHLARWKACSSLKVLSPMDPAAQAPPGVHLLRNTCGQEWTMAIEDGCPAWNNTGAGAVWLADTLGFSKIRLYGFEMQGNRFAEFRREFMERVAPNVKATVLNRSPGTELECFQ